MNAKTASRTSILVVEDFPLLRASVIEWLQMRFPACLIQGVGSAEHALRHLRETGADIVLMDIELPGINGLEATARIKEQAPRTAVVVLTLHDSPSRRAAATNAGAVGYVTKTDMEEYLGPIVEGLLNLRSGTLR